MRISEFWREAGRLPRAALACAGVAGALNVASYAGLTMSAAGGSLALVHLVVLALGFMLFGRLVRHHRLASREPHARPDRVPLPAQLRWATAASLVYVLALFVWLATAYGTGAPELRDGRELWVTGGAVVRELAPGTFARYEAHTLRLFSATWLFFGLLIALTAHAVDARMRAYRTTTASVAA